MRVFEHQGTDAKSVTLRPESDEPLTKGFVKAAGLFGVHSMEVVVIVNDWSVKTPPHLSKGKTSYLGQKTLQQCKELIDQYPDSYFLMFYKSKTDIEKMRDIKEVWESNHRDLVEGVCDMLVQTDHDWVSITFELPRDSKIKVRDVAKRLRQSLE